MNTDDERVVFFDIDGTLLDTSDFAETSRKAAIGLMVDNGLPLDKDEAYGVLMDIVKLGYIIRGETNIIMSIGMIIMRQMLHLLFLINMLLK